MHTDEGITRSARPGCWGAPTPSSAYLKEAEANHILGSDPFAVEDLVRRMKYGDYGRAGEIVMSGIAVVEMACWDIKGKALGVPVPAAARRQGHRQGEGVRQRLVHDRAGRRRRTTRPPRGSWSAGTGR
ncbi:hypothetical protein LV779_29310 [Streptomyces thinghirensis]|nr:hypothetical protein [Streptomyces thinghirensis]